jgi:hypothetical protein
MNIRYMLEELAYNIAIKLLMFAVDCEYFSEEFDPNNRSIVIKIRHKPIQDEDI